MKINAGQAPSTLVPKYIGSDYDKVKSVAENMDYVKKVAEGLKGSAGASFCQATAPTLDDGVANGSVWFCTTNGRTYIWYVDTDSAQWVESSP